MYSDYEVEFFENGKGCRWSNDGEGWYKQDEDNCWFVSNGALFYNEEDEGLEDAFIVSNIVKVSDTQLVLEFTGYVYKEDGTYDDYYLDSKGEIETWTRLE